MKGFYLTKIIMFISLLLVGVVSASEPVLKLPDGYDIYLHDIFNSNVLFAIKKENSEASSVLIRKINLNPDDDVNVLVSYYTEQEGYIKELEISCPEIVTLRKKQNNSLDDVVMIYQQKDALILTVGTMSAMDFQIIYDGFCEN